MSAYLNDPWVQTFVSGAVLALLGAIIRAITRTEPDGTRPKQPKDWQRVNRETRTPQTPKRTALAEFDAFVKATHALNESATRHKRVPLDEQYAQSLAQEYALHPIATPDEDVEGRNLRRLQEAREHQMDLRASQRLQNRLWGRI